MGQHMAYNLAAAGFSLRVHDRSSAALASLQERLSSGGISGPVVVAGSPQQMAQDPGVSSAGGAWQMKEVYAGFIPLAACRACAHCQALVHL